jgi:hypothetical protein
LSSAFWSSYEQRYINQQVIIMKFQLFTLAALTSLSFTSAAVANTVVHTNVNPIKQIDVNTAVKKNNIIQGSGQDVTATSKQNATIVTPSSAGKYGYVKPNVIVNTNVTPVTQVEVNTAVLSKGVTQGGDQKSNVNSTQGGLVTGRGADGSYIYNYNYSGTNQYQYNNAYYSNQIKQGGQQVVDTTAKTGANAGKK